MSNEKITELPTVANSLLADIIYAVQGGVSVQETLQQVFNLMLANTVLHNAGDPNGSVAGVIYQLCWDTSNSIGYICTSSGSVSTAVWTQLAVAVSAIINAAHGGTGTASPTIHTLPVAQGSNPFNFLGPLTNGQLLIGSTGADPVASAITAGAGISIGLTAGGISVTASGSGAFSWTDVTGTTQAMLTNHGYIADNAGLVTLTMPTLAAIGEQIDIVGKGAGGWIIAQNANQIIHVGSSTTTTGAGGSVASTNRYDNVILTCVVANLEWAARPPQGSLTIV